MSTSNRALRRHHRERLNKRTRYIFTKVWTWDQTDTDIEYRVNKLRDNMCANRYCQCCGNPRNKKRSWSKVRLTLQEQKQLECEMSQWNEVDI